jgi:transposase
MRYELNDHEWSAIKPMLPNKPRGAPCGFKLFVVGAAILRDDKKILRTMLRVVRANWYGTIKGTCSDCSPH